MKGKDMGKRVFYVLLFIAALYAAYYGCTRYDLHRADLSPRIGYFKLFALQALLAGCAAKAFFSNVTRKAAFGLGAVVSVVCMVFVFMRETLGSFTIDAEFSTVLQAMLDPGMFLLHIAYGALLFIALRAAADWFAQEMGERPEQA